MTHRDPRLIHATEYVAIDHLGLTPPGESWRAVEDGTIVRGGSCPVNMSGDLIR